MITIGICGGSASGKTTLVNQLKQYYNADDICVISQDAYYKKTDNLSFEEKKNLNFDHPAAIDFDLMVAQLKTLLSGKKIAQPIYDFEIHNRLDKTKTIHPKKIVIIEGILIFNDKRLLDLLGVKIFIDADEKTRLARRIKRDFTERGRSEQQTISQFNKTVKPMHDSYITPSKTVADHCFSSSQNNINICEEVIKIIKKHLTK